MRRNAVALFKRALRTLALHLLSGINPPRVPAPSVNIHTEYRESIIGPIRMDLR
jgi:hypothetical protein